MLRSTAPALVGLAILLSPLTARAECVELSPTYAMGERSIELVFSGRVVETTRTAELGYRATFDVERVWKGSVPKRFDVYVWEITGEVPSQLEFAPGRHVVVLAKRLTEPLERVGIGLAGTDKLAFTAARCSMGLAPAKFERDLGPGYPAAADGAASPQPLGLSTACGWPFVLIPTSAQEPVRIHVSDPRPVAAAVREVEKHFGTIVTYEDTSYVHPSQVVDVTEQVRRDGDTSKRVLAMRRGTIDVDYTPPPTAAVDQIRRLLEEILAASKAAGNAGEFKIISGVGRFHVVPIARKGVNGASEPYGSPLDVQIDLPCQSENGYEFAVRLARTISARAGRRITPGTLPTNLFLQNRVHVCASKENAREVLWRALQTIREDLSWRMLCDVGEAARCAINIHWVEPRNASNKRAPRG